MAAPQCLPQSTSGGRAGGDHRCVEWEAEAQEGSSPHQVPERSRVSPVASPATARTVAAASPGPDSRGSAFLAVLLNPRAWDPLGRALRIPVLILYLKFGLFISKAEQKADETEPPSPVLTVKPAPWAPETLGHGDSLGLSL